GETDRDNDEANNCTVRAMGYHSPNVTANKTTDRHRHRVTPAHIIFEHEHQDRYSSHAKSEEVFERDQHAGYCCDQICPERLARAPMVAREANALPYHGNASKSTLPPVRMMPIRSPTTLLSSSIAAYGTAADGSTTIFIVSQIVRIAEMIASSLTVTMASTY